MQITAKKFSSIYASDKMKPWCKFDPDLDGIDIDDDVDAVGAVCECLLSRLIEKAGKEIYI